MLGLVGMIGSFIARSFDNDIDYWVPAEEVARIENERFALLEKGQTALAARLYNPYAHFHKDRYA